MIARVAISPLEAHRVSRSEHEGAALLYRIALPYSLAEAAREGADTLDHRERVKGLGPAMGEPGFPERAERGVDEERAVIAGRRAEAGDVLGPRRAQNDQRGARSAIAGCTALSPATCWRQKIQPKCRTNATTAGRCSQVDPSTAARPRSSSTVSGASRAASGLLMPGIVARMREP